MLLGDTNVYFCPHCSGAVLQERVTSANGIGARYYSDGLVKGPYLPRIVLVTRCGHCSQIFWLDEILLLDKIEDEPTDQLAINKSVFFRLHGTYAFHLDKEGLMEALHEKCFRTPQEEVYLRQRLLWLLNEPLLSSENFPNEEHQLTWKENCMVLIQLLKPVSEHEFLLLAELYRNIQDFDACMDTLDRVTDKQLLSKAFAIFNKCQKHEWKVFEFPFEGPIWMR
ncbi:MAG: hypothetical protein ACXIUD_06225 [Mongoliitalea sp.]